MAKVDVTIKIRFATQSDVKFKVSRWLIIFKNKNKHKKSDYYDKRISVLLSLYVGSTAKLAARFY